MSSNIKIRRSPLRWKIVRKFSNFNSNENFLLIKQKKFVEGIARYRYQDMNKNQFRFEMQIYGKICKRDSHIQKIFRKCLLLALESNIETTLKCHRTWKLRLLKWFVADFLLSFSLSLAPLGFSNNNFFVQFAVASFNKIISMNAIFPLNLFEF